MAFRQALRLAIGLAVGAACIVGPPAHGATVFSEEEIEFREDYTYVNVTDDAGEKNDLVVDKTRGGRFEVRERGSAPLRAAGDCSQKSRHVVRCGYYIDEINISLGPRDDIARIAAGRLGYVEAWGEAGDDYLDLTGGSADLFGGPGRDHLLGGPGRDEIYGGGGRDRIRGRAGNDLLSGDGLRYEKDGASHGSDFVDGGTGTDMASWEDSTKPIAVDLRAPQRAVGEGERDSLHGIESVVGGLADDRLVGNGRRNKLLGRAGRDVLRGGGGNDRINGGAGGRFWGQVSPDASRDLIKCGPGADRVGGVVTHANPRRRADTLGQACEQVVIDRVVLAVPRLELSSSTVRVELFCGGYDQACQRQAILRSDGRELGRSASVKLVKENRRAVTVKLDEPLRRGPTIVVFFDGRNWEQGYGESNARNYDTLLRLRRP